MILDILTGVLGASCVAVIVYAIFVSRFIAVMQNMGPSMSPTICDGDYVVVRRITKRHRFRAGRIYAFYPPKTKEYRVVKRLKEILPDGRLYFLGDNADHSMDSRHFGAVEPQQVTFVVVKRILNTEKAREKFFLDEDVETLDSH